MQRIWIFCSKILPCLTSTTAISHCKKWWFQGPWPLLILLACFFSLSIFPWKLPPGWVTRGFGATSWSPTQVDLASSSLRRVVGDLCVTWLRGEAFWWDGRNAAPLKGAFEMDVFVALSQIKRLWLCDIIWTSICSEWKWFHFLKKPPKIKIQKSFKFITKLMVIDRKQQKKVPKNPKKTDEFNQIEAPTLGPATGTWSIWVSPRRTHSNTRKGRKNQIQQLFVKFRAKFSFEAVGMLFPPFRKFPPFFKKKWCQFCWRERIMFFRKAQNLISFTCAGHELLRGLHFAESSPSVHPYYHQYAALAFMVKTSNVAESWENPQFSFKHDSQCWIWKVHTNMSAFECSRSTLAEGFVDAQLRCNRYQFFSWWIWRV